MKIHRFFSGSQRHVLATAKRRLRDVIREQTIDDHSAANATTAEWQVFHDFTLSAFTYTSLGGGETNGYDVHCCKKFRAKGKLTCATVNIAHYNSPVGYIHERNIVTQTNG